MPNGRAQGCVFFLPEKNGSGFSEALNTGVLNAGVFFSKENRPWISGKPEHLTNAPKAFFPAKNDPLIFHSLEPPTGMLKVVFLLEKKGARILLYKYFPSSVTCQHF